MLSDGRILDSLQRLRAEGEAGEAPEAGGPSLGGWFVLLSGFIPRGRARAPEPVVPNGLEPEALSAGLRRNRARVEALGSELALMEKVRNTSRHPILGRFTPRRWIRFAGVHQHHHEKIVRDILRPVREGP